MSARDLTIFMISFISSFEIISVVIPDPKILFWIAASVADTDAVNPNGIKTILANGLSILLIKGEPIFSSGPKSLPENLPDSPILDNYFFVSFILAEEPFAKVLRSLKICVLVNKIYAEI